MDTEQQVAKHYSQGTIEKTILDALRANGKNVDKLTAGDLTNGDEFHLGWLPATIELAKDLGFARDMHVLDVGAGIGGPARYFAETCGCRVTGIDLTPEFVEVANRLTRRCGLADKASFREASALALPFEDAAFDAATLIHVGMNIADKAKLFSEARRVLKKGGGFAVYDVMKMDQSELPYPMPWAATPATSFPQTPETYRKLLAAAGFTIESETNRREFALNLAREMRERIEKYGPPLLGPQVLMGSAAKERLGNVMATLERGAIAPIEMIARAV
jgi:ubiquinone/menaquinone biosynthesis C-methylase UbiE